MLIAYLTELIFIFFFPYLINSIEQSGHYIEIIVKITMPTQDVPRGMIAELPVSLNPLKYTYGLALCWALILSSAAGLQKTLLNILISVLLLLPFQIWSIYFEVMEILFFKTEPNLLAYVYLFPWQLDIIAICYQIGALIIPPISPIIIWLFLYQKYVFKIIPKLDLFLTNLAFNWVISWE